MTFVKNLVGDLVDKRLWPLALGLVIALVAVPVVLSRSGGTSAPETPPPNPLLGKGSAALLGETKPAVSLGAEGGFRKHIGHLSRKNPFVQQALPKAGKSEGLTVTSPAGATGPSGTSPTPTPTPTPTPGTPGQTKVKRFQFTAIVRFGQIGKTSSKTLKPGTVLPSENNPVVIYIGSDGKKALFLVSTEATPHGDGECLPSESSCQFLRMSKGDTEFFEVALSADSVITYELDLRDIGSREISSTAVNRTLQRLPLQNLDSSRLRRIKQAMQTRKVFKALGQLAP